MTICKFLSYLKFMDNRYTPLSSANLLSSLHSHKGRSLHLLSLVCIFFLLFPMVLRAQVPVDSLYSGKVGEKQMKKGMVNSALDVLNGQTAGVQVQTNVNQEVMMSAVRVRGTTSLTGGNDPLVIIDGVASDLSTLSTVYPADIESFTVLKDPAETSQYGSRGASGVIQVATKRGKGGKFHISYDGNFGFESVYKKLNMLSADEFRQQAERMGLGLVDGNQNVNHQKGILRTGTVQHHHVAFGGGTDDSNYRVSLGLMDHRTVIKTNRLRNYIAKVDMMQKAFDNRVTFDLGVFGSIQKANRIPFLQKLLYSAEAFNPTVSAERGDNGDFTYIPEAPWINNPGAMLAMKDDEDYAHLNAHIRAKIDLGYGILMTLFGSYSYNDTDNAHIYNGEVYRADGKSEEVLANISISKTFDFRNSSLSLFAMGERQSVESKGFHVTASNLATEAFGYDNLAIGSERLWTGTGSFAQDSRLSSFLFSAKYTLMKRYTLSVNARADGSSKVGRNNRWGFFPSVSGSWVIWDKSLARHHHEGLIYDVVDNFKVRMGYGVSGNLGGIDAYNSMQLVAPNGVINVNGRTTTTLAVIRNANPDLKWEVKRTFNIGLNASFWEKRIALSMDYYQSKISDMLYIYDVPVPPFIYDKMLANLGTMRNSGFELGFGITPLSTKDMELHVGMNMSFERNKLVSLDGDYRGQHLTAPVSKGVAGVSGAGFHGGNNVVFQMVGQPLGVFYLPHCKGVKYDEEGRGTYDITSEKYVCGQAMPKMRLGSNIAFRYRQWDIAMQVNGAFGHKIFNGTKLTYMNVLSVPNYNVMVGAPEKNIQAQALSDYYLERGDYLNIDYVTIGWNIPISSPYIQSLRVSASVNNLYTFTKYSGLTPLVNSSVMNGTLGVDDKNIIPPYRTYSMGISIQF